MEVTCRPLVEVLGDVQERRSARGIRHPLQAVLALACAAMLCGYHSYEAIAQWGRDYGSDIARALGFTRDKTPCAATFFNIFSRLDRADLESKLGQWAQSVLLAIPLAPDQSEGVYEGVSIDGKTLRGSAKMGAPGAHLLSAFSHRLGVTLGQHAVEDKTNEIGAVGELLKGLILEGKVLTMDALLTQRPVAETVVEKGGTT